MSNIELPTLILSALATGLAGSAHCMAMCGGIGGSLGLNVRSQRYLLAYQAGRILSYCMIGIFLGMLLPLLGIRTQIPHWNGLLRWLSAVIITLTGVGMLLPTTPWRWLERYGYYLWRPIAYCTQAFLPIKSYSDGFILGIMWGLLPCGLIYSALGLALASANPFCAGVIMLSFGVGTLPSMLAVTFFSAAIIKPLASDIGRQALATIVIVLGLWAAWQASIMHLR